MRILEIVLAFGNYLNFGTNRGHALGFRLDALTKLADTKAVDKKTTLLHYLANFLDEREPEMLSWADEMQAVKQAVKVDFQTLNDDLSRTLTGLQELEEEIQLAMEDTPLKGDNFLVVMQDFVENATDSVGQVDCVVASCWSLCVCVCFSNAIVGGVGGGV